MIEEHHLTSLKNAFVIASGTRLSDERRVEGMSLETGDVGT
jgi:hypothetical protein